MSDFDPKNIPNCFYRISIKALILNETRDKFLIVQEEDGKWELPGGGLDWGMTPQEDLPREIDEEMGLEVTWIADNPCYFITGKNSNGSPKANILYEAKLNSLDFTPSDECVAVKFVNKEEDGEWLKEQNLYYNVPQLIEMFDPKNHQ